MTVIKIEVIGNYGAAGEFRKLWEMKIDDAKPEPCQTPQGGMIYIPVMVAESALAEALKGRKELCVDNG
jgi:hypothetical protein